MNCWLHRELNSDLEVSFFTIQRGRQNFVISIVNDVFIQVSHLILPNCIFWLNFLDGRWIVVRELEFKKWHKELKATLPLVHSQLPLSLVSLAALKWAVSRYFCLKSTEPSLRTTEQEFHLAACCWPQTLSWRCFILSFPLWRNQIIDDKIIKQNEFSYLWQLWSTYIQYAALLFMVILYFLHDPGCRIRSFIKRSL